MTAVFFSIGRRKSIKSKSFRKGQTRPLHSGNECVNHVIFLWTNYTRQTLKFLKIKFRRSHKCKLILSWKTSKSFLAFQNNFSHGKSPSSKPNQTNHRQESLMKKLNKPISLSSQIKGNKLICVKAGKCGRRFTNRSRILQKFAERMRLAKNKLNCRQHKWTWIS